MTTRIEARPLFDATLRPHRSLGRRGLRIVAVSMAVAASLPAIVFFSLGAWPIVGFLGLDVLLVWWALSSSARDAQQFETVALWPDRLDVRRVSAAGREETLSFDPRLVKLVIDRDYDERTTGLHLRTRDGDTVIGAFLAAEEKASFARAFGTALRRARH